jgi:hypothetical protein
MATPTIPLGSRENPRPFLYVLTAKKMKPGTYRAWRCKHCGLPIAPNPTYTGADPDRQRPETLLRVTSPHCKKVEDRIWAGLEDIEYKGKPVR